MSVTAFINKNLSLKKIAMAKSGSEKNTKNKAKHTKLMNRKKNKLRQEKVDRKARLKELTAKMKEKKQG
jgi:hypothetical protein